MALDTSQAFDPRYGGQSHEFYKLKQRLQSMHTTMDKKKQEWMNSLLQNTGIAQSTDLSRQFSTLMSQASGQTLGQTSGQTLGQTSGQTLGQTSGQTLGQTSESKLASTTSDTTSTATFDATAAQVEQQFLYLQNELNTKFRSSFATRLADTARPLNTVYQTLASTNDNNDQKAKAIQTVVNYSSQQLYKLLYQPGASRSFHPCQQVKSDHLRLEPFCLRAMRNNEVLSCTDVTWSDQNSHANSANPQDFQNSHANSANPQDFQQPYTFEEWTHMVYHLNSDHTAAHLFVTGQLWKWDRATDVYTSYPVLAVYTLTKTTCELKDVHVLNELAHYKPVDLRFTSNQLSTSNHLWILIRAPFCDSMLVSIALENETLIKQRTFHTIHPPSSATLSSKCSPLTFHIQETTSSVSSASCIDIFHHCLPTDRPRVSVRWDRWKLENNKLLFVASYCLPTYESFISTPSDSSDESTTKPVGSVFITDIVPLQSSMYHCLGWYTNTHGHSVIWTAETIFQSDSLHHIARQTYNTSTYPQKWKSDNTFTIHQPLDRKSQLHQVEAASFKTVIVECPYGCNIIDENAFYHAEQQYWRLLKSRDESKEATDDIRVYRTISSGDYTQMTRIPALSCIVCVGSVLNGVQRPTIDRDACLSLIRY
jgi:hypothetical protein